MRNDREVTDGMMIRMGGRFWRCHQNRGNLEHQWRHLVEKFAEFRHLLCCSGTRVSKTVGDSDSDKKWLGDSEGSRLSIFKIFFFSAETVIRRCVVCSRTSSRNAPSWTESRMKLDDLRRAWEWGVWGLVGISVFKIMFKLERQTILENSFKISKKTVLN